MGPLAAFVALGFTISVIAFGYAKQRRAESICREDGHIWEHDYTGWECARCFERVYSAPRSDV